MKKKIVTISFIAVFSIILWASVSLTDVYVTTIRVPVNFTDLPGNYSVGYSSVEIFGSANLLHKIDSIKTEYRAFLNVSGNVKIDLPIEAPNGIFLANQTCLLEFEVQKIVDKTFEELPVETRNVPAAKELILYPNKISVVLRGGINILGRLTNDSIKAYINYWTALREESGTIEPTITIPQFTTLINTVPKKLEYIIKQY